MEKVVIVKLVLISEVMMPTGVNQEVVVAAVAVTAGAALSLRSPSW